MPTGYTAAIEKGCSFSEYIWGCARAFGALVTMRDDSSDAKIPERLTPCSYNLDRIAEIQKELSSIDKMKRSDIEKAIKNERDEVIKRNTKYREEFDLKRERYEKMAKQAQGWVPPTVDHVKLKEFMIQQIEVSRCGSLFQEPILDLTVEEWIENKKYKLYSDLEYSSKQHAEELERTAKRNQWLKALRDSVPQPK